MQNIEHIINLKATMERELTLIRDFNKRYEELRSAVQQKQWNKLQQVLKDCSRIASEVEVIEEKRESLTKTLYRTFSLSSNANFLELAGFCPTDIAIHLKTNYLNLRAEVYRMKCRLKSLEAYGRVRMQLVDQVMTRAQAVQATNNPYMRSGRKAINDNQSFLFSSTK